MGNNMEKEFVSYEQAVALKELGFNFLCVAFWSNIVDNKATEIYTIRIGLDSFTREIKGINYTGFLSAPLKQQVFRWFREKYGYDIAIGNINNKYSGSIRSNKTNYYLSATNEYSTYEEAEDACIDKLISIAKQQDK